LDALNRVISHKDEEHAKIVGTNVLVLKASMDATIITLREEIEEMLTPST
jgi:hypothetical protein